MDLVKDRIDPEKAKKGTAYSLNDTTTVQIRRWNNAEYRRALLDMREEKLAELKLADDAKLPDDVSRDIMAKAMSEHIVVGWHGFTRNGKAVAYTSAKAYEFLSDEGFEDEMFRIINASANRERFLADRKVARVKKS